MSRPPPCTDACSKVKSATLRRTCLNLCATTNLLPGGAKSPPSPPPSPPPLDHPTVGTWERDALDAHNVFPRALHCAPPLSWDGELAGRAQRARRRVRRRAHARRLRELIGFEPDEAHAQVSRWYYAGARAYSDPPSFGAEPLPANFSEWGQFTQLVWSGTARVGCGRAAPACEGGPTYICKYAAPGNIAGGFAANVHPPACGWHCRPDQPCARVQQSSLRRAETEGFGVSYRGRHAMNLLDDGAGAIARSR